MPETRGLPLIMRGRCYHSLIKVGSIALAFVCAAAFAQQPRIDSVSPSQGPIAGDTIVTITGANFAGAAVRLDRAVGSPISETDSEIRIQMPKHDNGYVVISVGNSAGVARTEYLYLPPRLDELQPGEITTIAGVGKYDHAFGRATEAMIHANGFDFDDAGNTYLTDNNANRIYVVHADGTIEPFAGSGAAQGPAGDGGSALDAVISFPHNIALDDAGAMYVPDANNRIRRIDRDGVITTIAGTGVRGFSGDGGPAIAAKIDNPSYIAADGNDVFFIDFGNLRIRRIHLADGTILTLAGDGVAGFTGDGGPATSARFNEASPDDGGLLLDAAGNLYLLDARNGRIRRIDRQTGVIDTVLIVRDTKGNIVNNVTAFALDRDGNMYYSYGGFIAKANPSGTTIAEWGHRDGPRGFSEDGSPATPAFYSQLNFLGIDRQGNVAFDDSSVGRLRRINGSTGLLETIAGMRPPIYAENGRATGAILVTSDGGDLDLTPSGELLIADTWNYRIRRLDRSGSLTTIAGNGTLDGPADGVGATQTGVVALAVHADGTAMDVTPFGFVTRIGPDGIVHRVVKGIGGGGNCGLTGDGGLARDATVCQPWDTARDRSGNLYIADTNNNRIRRIDAITGVITTVAGNGGP
ncbi:MAG TPA: IPT/TIG domain-containing protein, partial [Thermoanaerobaculia bacterium]|nr:IPT/TIG domain-containing protein [Thermoanaerobaculia bacterium]